jgi:RNA polymerase sigma-70 factor, ECF subfamily
MGWRGQAVAAKGFFHLRGKKSHPLNNSIMTASAENDGGRLGQSDWQLARRARGGDIAAFHELVDRHAASLLGMATMLVGNAADAEDVVQETLAGAFRGLGSFRGDSAVKTWLTRILLRQAAGLLRRRMRHPAVSLEAADPASRSRYAGPSVPAGTGRADARMDLAAALAAMSEEHRQVLVLRELQGLSYDEIAEILSVPRGTVESRLFRARRAMQDRLKDYL